MWSELRPTLCREGATEKGSGSPPPCWLCAPGHNPGGLQGPRQRGGAAGTKSRRLLLQTREPGLGPGRAWTRPALARLSWPWSSLSQTSGTARNDHSRGTRYLVLGVWWRGVGRRTMTNGEMIGEKTGPMAGWGAGEAGGGVPRAGRVYISCASGSLSSTPLDMLLSCRRFTRYASKWMLLVMSLMFCMCVLMRRSRR